MVDPVAVALGQRALLNYRPVRLAFSVRRADSEGLREVIQYCTSVWGGVHNVIAIENDDATWSDFSAASIEAVDPDEVYVIGDDAFRRSQALLERYKRPVAMSKQLLREYTPPPGVADQRMESWWDKPWPLWALALGGDVCSPGSQTRTDLTDQEAIEVFLAALDGQSPIATTGRGVHVLRSEMGLEAALIFVAVGKPRDVESLAYFWNVRALDAPLNIPVVLLPLEHDLTTAAPAVERVIARSSYRSEPDVLVFGDADQGAVSSAMAALGLAEHVGTSVTVYLGGERAEHVLTYGRVRTPRPTRQRLSSERSEDYPIQLGDETRLRVDPTQAARGLPGSIALQLSRFPPLVMPMRPELTSLVHPHAHPSPDGIFWIGGFTQRSELPIKLPADADVVRALLQSIGLSFGISSAGAASNRILLALGGGLAGIEVLRAEMPLRVLEALGPVREQRIVQRINALMRDAPSKEDAIVAAERNALSDLRDLHVFVPRVSLSLPELASRAHAPEADLAATLQLLVRRRVLFLGVSVTCAHCGHSEWRAVDDTAMEMTCVGCRQLVGLLDVAPAGSREPRWEYTLNRAFAWPYEQDVLPALFAAAVLSRRASSAFRFVAGVQTEGANGPEFDLIATIDEHIAVVEAKSGSTATTQEIERTTVLAKRLGGHAIFATLSNWSAESIARFEVARAQGTIELLERDALIAR